MSGFYFGDPLPPPNPLIYPIVMTQAGVLPQNPQDLLTALINLVTYGTDQTGASVMTPDPGYTASLPGSLIEDISSTDIGACVLMDQARVELINSLTPYGANAFILAQLGSLLGVPIGLQSNMSVSVIFSGTPGFLIQSGFQVSDGNHTYVTQQPTVIAGSGSSLPVTAVAEIAGVWQVPLNSVTTIVTSVPTGVTLTVDNPFAVGMPGTIQESEQAYRLRVLQAETVACQGTAPFLKTLLSQVPGVVPNQIAVQSVSGGGWKVICGGSSPDTNQIAAAIYLAVPDIGMLVTSTLAVTAITQANPGVVTTDLNHLLVNGQTATISGSNPTNYNGSGTVTVIDEKNFSIAINTTGFPSYVGSAIVTPNIRNNLATIDDYPDSYVIPFITPPSQTATVVLTWNTPNPFAAAIVFNQAAQTAIIQYINAIPVGAPINLFAMQEAVQAATSSILLLSQLTRMVWSVAINGVTTPPISGTGEIVGDPESYFTSSPATVTVTQG